MPGTAREMDPPASDLKEEQHIDPAQPDRFNHEEVSGQQLMGVLTDKLAPGALATPRCWQKAVATKDVAQVL